MTIREAICAACSRWAAGTAANSLHAPEVSASPSPMDCAPHSLIAANRARLSSWLSAVTSVR